MLVLDENQQYDTTCTYRTFTKAMVLKPGKLVKLAKQLKKCI